MSASKGHSDIQMLLLDNLAVKLNEKKSLHKMMMDYSIYTKLAYCYCTNCFLLCLTIFRIDNFYVRGRECPRHSGLESLPLLRHCRDPMQSQQSPRNIKIFKKVGDDYVIAANEHFVKKIYYLVYDRNHIYCIFFY